MKFSSDELGVSFAVPDKLTNRQQLQYISDAAGRSELSQLERLWIAALPLLADWQCASIPNPQAHDLDASTDFGAARIIAYVGGKVAEHVAGLANVPKAS